MAVAARSGIFSTRSPAVHGTPYVPPYVACVTIQDVPHVGIARRAVMRCANLEITPSAERAQLGGRPLDLTPREFQLLLVLAERRNRVVPRADLYELVWCRRMSYRDRSVDVFVRKLRLRLHDAAPGWMYIQTHFGVGYRFAPRRVLAAAGRLAHDRNAGSHTRPQRSLNLSRARETTKVVLLGDVVFHRSNDHTTPAHRRPRPCRPRRRVRARGLRLVFELGLQRRLIQLDDRREGRSEHDHNGECIDDLEPAARGR
jgi:DNA-binding winged helix-turn-helix (wHTH) protein